MILIIAEKPSLGRNIAAALEEGKLDTFRKQKGFLSGENYAVTWAFGHLFELCDVEEYAPRPEGAKGWTMKNIPCFPKEFRYRLIEKEGDTGVREQFETVKSLCNRADVTAVINAGDSDREGEIIVRTLVRNCFAEGAAKPLLRLWLPDQTAQTILSAVQDPPPDGNYDHLAREGYARTYIDWLYGINLTRYATLRTGKLLRVGRVVVPVVKAIYDRDLAIRNFVPETYFQPVSKAETNGEEVVLSSKKQFSKDEKEKAERFCAAYNALPCTVKDVKKRATELKPGKLFSLSTLQNVLGKKYKMSMDDSLKTVQDLYEKGYLSYPRTNSEYLATAEKDKFRTIVANVAKLGYPVKFKDAKSIFDDSKIEAHSALTPTYKIPGKDDLTDREKTVYSTVLRRFVAVFCAEECKAEKTEITIDLGGKEEFLLKGTVILTPGWTRFEDSATKDKVLPALKKGDAVNVAFRPEEKQTTAPKHHTIETLNRYLKNPFRDEKEKIETEDDAEEYKAIFEGLELGTEATRTGIIEKAIETKYIQLKKDVYTILPDGEYLIEHLGTLGISMDKYRTSELGKALKQVYRGEMTVEQSVALAEEEIRAVFSHAAPHPETPVGEDDFDGYFRDEIGVCPLCGGKVIKGYYSYGCLNRRETNCPFRVGTQILGRVVPVSAMRQLLETGKTDVIKGFLSKRTGKLFDARLVLDENKEAKFDFNS